MVNYLDVDWKNFVYYDKTSYSFLRWRDNLVLRNGRVLHLKDKEAGGKTKSGYFKITLKGISYFSHRIIWILHNGQIPDNYFIDHIDCNKSNNTIDNLRIVTTRENGHNMGLISRNTSGISGVNFQTNSCGNEYWVAQWKCFKTGKHKAKSFSILRYGYDSALEMAKSHRVAILIEQNNIGAMYSDRHIAASTG